MERHDYRRIQAMDQGTLTHSILESALRRGLGVRQLARLTGVSYGIIQRINEKWVKEPSPLTHIPEENQKKLLARRDISAICVYI